jgi:hypothetical protein
MLMVDIIFFRWMVSCKGGIPFDESGLTQQAGGASRVFPNKFYIINNTARIFLMR